MRVRIRTSTEQQFEEVRRFLRAVTTIQLESLVRKTIAVEDLPEAMIAEVEALGGKVLPDTQYDLDEV